jgi:pullulanase/glycogen debranching enzyme
MRMWPGSRFPLGANWDGQGMNFPIFSENATKIELFLFARVERGLVQRLGSTEDVNVVVEAGIATITGTTSTVENHRIVEDITLKSGAFDVVNQIQVKEDGTHRPSDQ